VLGESVRRRSHHRPTHVGPRPRRWLAWLIGIPMALLVPFGIGYFVAVRVLFPPPQASGTGIAVPELIGRDHAEALRLVVSAGLGGLEPMTLPHPSAPPGQIIAQNPLPGQQLRSGATVQVALSSGPPRVRIPDVIGFGADAAISMLRRSGFEVIQARKESAGAPGRIISMDPTPGQVRQLPATVTIVVSASIPADTVRPDTTDRSRAGVIEDPAKATTGASSGYSQL
jgi:eukaryotic-like serine/threonine-protein kinase